MDDNKVQRIIITLKQGWYIVRVEYTNAPSDVLSYDNEDEALASRDQYLAEWPDASVEYRGFKPSY